ncbi:hypothetical protein DM860_004793 [Cuscuta australis]|uniref:Uncharacterized protein n=1 Tax=Cuscuta australis TaxID=267555 RepID=A0A328DLM6_9ASTE|nr:hypothetical protein DM860_004793 [Cuscuta australis]
MFGSGQVRPPAFNNTTHTRPATFAEPELKKQRLGADSDGIGGDSISDGSGGGSNGSCGVSNSDGSGVSNVFIGNEQDDVYFEEYKYMLEPEDYENSTLEEKRQYGRYFHQIRISNCYYLDFIPTSPLWTGPRPMDFTKEDDRDSYEAQVMRCIEVAQERRYRGNKNLHT